MPDYSFEVDLAALQKAAQGITDAVKSIKDDDVSDWLPEVEEQVGNATVWDALDTFGGRWNVGMENLTSDVEEAGNRLMQILMTYAKYDESSTSLMKKSVKSAGGIRFPVLGEGGFASQGTGQQDQPPQSTKDIR